ncbi:MAG: hypothetical protein OEZ39_18260 [Gammaproteobacteria bacterium]|nr:hypothetical protein [Gammaproteobacteria bacterium]MDH5653811.1 hypothetical protein [Gammaproteobacteria bacterium]
MRSLRHPTLPVLLLFLSACSVFEDMGHICIHDNIVLQSECLKRNRELMQEREARRDARAEEERMAKENAEQAALTKQIMEEYYRKQAAARTAAIPPVKQRDTRRYTLQDWQKAIRQDLPDHSPLYIAVNWGQKNALAMQYGKTPPGFKGHRLIILLAYTKQSAIVRRFADCRCEHCLHDQESGIIADLFYDMNSELILNKSKVVNTTQPFCGNKKP